MSHASSSGPQSWRRRSPAVEEDERGSRTIRRVISTAIFLALVALFVYLGYLVVRKPQTYVAVLPIDANQAMGYANPNWNGAMPIFKDLPSANSAITVDDWNDSGPSSSKTLEEGVANKIGQWSPDNNDMVIVYVSANSVCAKGEPYVLYEDFQLDDLAAKTPTRAVPVAALFEQLAECQAPCKLLVIDTGRIAYDPRLGVLVNEFPRLVEQKLKECGDENLFVLLPCSSFESTASVDSINPSPFAHLFTRALSGEADGAADQDPDQQLTLAELYSFAWNCSLASFGDAAAFRQTPVLMRGGRGVVQGSDQLVEKIVVGRLPMPPKLNEDGNDEDPGSNDTEKKTEKVAQDRMRRGVSAVGLAWMQGPPKEKNAERKKKELPPNKTESDRTETKTDGDVKGSKPKAESASPASETPKTDSTAESAKTDTSPKPAVDTTPQKDSTEDPVKVPGRAANRWSDELDRMWKTRDALVSVDRDFWGPVDAAPHLWRSIESKLRKFESSVVNGNGPFSPRDISKMSDELESLLEFLRDPQKRTPSDLGGDLLKITEFVTGYLRAQREVSSEPTAQSSVDLLNLVQRDYNHMLFTIVSHHRWLTDFQARLGSRDSTFERSRELASTFREQFLELREKLKMMENPDSGNPDLENPQEASAIHRLDENVLQDLLENLRQAARDVDKQVVDDVQQVLESNGLAAEQQRNLLLRTSLLTAEQRRQLNQDRPNGQISLPKPDQYDSPKAPDLNRIAAYREQLDALVDLEIQAIATVDPDKENELGQVLEVLEDEDDPWIVYREIGSKLADWYRKVPDDLRDLGSTVDSSTLRRTRDLLVFVDPRDVHRVRSDVQLGRDFRLKPRKPNPRLNFSDFVENRRSVNTSQREPALYQLKFTATEVTGPIQFSATFNQEYMKLFYDGKPVTPETWTQLHDKDRSEQEVTLQILALDEREDGSPDESMSIRLRTDGAGDAERVVRYKLPLPNIVDLLVLREGSTNTLGRFDEDVLLLESIPSPPDAEPFPSEFKFHLRNVSGVEKTIRAQLIRVPKIRNQTWAPGRVGQNGQADPMTLEAIFVDGKPSRGLRDEIATKNVLAEVEVPLPADSSEQPLPFAVKKPAAAADADAAAATKPAGEEPKSVDVTHGLLCLLTDVSDEEQVWPKWLELRPLHPRKYMEAEARYEDGVIYATTTLKDDVDGDEKRDDIFRWTEDSPGSIQWGDGIQKPGFQNSITLESGSIAARGQIEQVKLSIDGYPRAFVIDVECRSNGEITNYELGDYQQSSLHSVTAVFPGTVASPAPPDQTKPFDFDGSVNQRLVFKPCKQLRVAFAIDVRTDTFVGDYAPEKCIRLLVNDEPRGSPLYADRVVQSQLLSCEGNVVLSTFVTDYEVPIPATVSNESMTIQVKLPSNKSSAPGQVYLDSRPPTIDRDAATIPNSVSQGKPLRPTIEFEDAGGLGTVQIGFDVAAPFLELNEADAPQPPIDLSGFGTKTTKKFDLPTDKLTPREDPYRIIVRHTDLAGNPGQPIIFKVQIKAPSPELMKTNVIRGYVVDWKGQPIKGGDWTLTVSGPDTEATLKHEESVQFFNGKFEFLKLVPGKYKVTVVGPGGFGKVGDRKTIQALPEKDAQSRKLQANVDNYKKMSAPAN